jgi:hypothetical protein
METKKEIVRAKRTNPRLETRHLDQIRPIDRFFFALARLVGFNNMLIEAINRGRMGVILLSIFVSWIIGNYTSHLVFTVLLLFFALLLRTAYHFEFCDYDNLYQQYKARQKKADNTNQWSLKGLKKRSKWYLVTFIMLFVISLIQSPYIGVELTSKAIFAIAFGCLIASLVCLLLVEYTFGGLHRNRKLHYVLIVTLIIYAFGRYVFDFIG